MARLNKTWTVSSQDVAAATAEEVLHGAHNVSEEAPERLPAELLATDAVIDAATGVVADAAQDGMRPAPKGKKRRSAPAAPGLALAAELHRVLEVSNRQAKGLIDARCVKVNGADAKSYGLRLKAGDEIAVSYEEARAYPTFPSTKKCMDESGFIILHEDQHVLFVDKPAGLLTVPAEKGHESNLAESITDHYRRRGFKRFHLFIVHRLDRFTSGVLVFAKTPEALHGLKTLFESHHLQRVYKAILVGELPENVGTLTGKLIEHSKSLRISVVDEKRDQKGAKHAITHYRVLERLPGHTVVEVKLETGRRNQIRVQFADRGFPLLGDHVYGEKCELIDRQALHAELLGFRHPVTDEQVTIQSPLPKDMETALKVLRTTRRVERAEAGLQGEEGIYKPKITPGRKFDRVSRARRYNEIQGGGQDNRHENRSEHSAGREDRFGGEQHRSFDSGGRPEGAGRPASGRPSTERSGSGRPSTGRPSTGRPSTGRPSAERPGAGRSGAGRPSAGRPDAERRSEGGRSEESRSPRPTGERREREGHRGGSNRPDARPAGRPDARPAGRSDARPAGRPDSRSGSRTGVRPEGRPSARPAGRPEARPAGRPDSRSGNAGAGEVFGRRPEGSKGASRPSRPAFKRTK